MEILDSKMQNQEEKQGIDKRRYVRMDTVLPVEVLIHNDYKKKSSHILQAFTRNVSRGGLCIECRVDKPEDAKLLYMSGSMLHLQIDVPFSQDPIGAESNIAWIQEPKDEKNPKYLFGVAYDTIDENDAVRILRYANKRKWLPLFFGISILVLLIGVAGLFIHQQYLIKQNQNLVQSLVKSAESQQVLMSDLDALGQREKDLKEDLVDHEETLSILQGTLQENELSESELTEIKSELEAALEREKELKGEITSLKQKQQTYADTLKQNEGDDRSTRQQVVRQLYSWLVKHVNSTTGLIPSYEGDLNLENISFTYDQSLSIITFSLLGDFDFAKKILSFYQTQAKTSEGGFVNAYDTISGQPLEWTVHVGPNVWLGIAVLQYEKFSGDSQFRDVALSIGEWLLDLQYQDEDFGLKGGPQEVWFSTEHNLDAYAFYEMLHKITGDQQYLQAREDTLNWILTHAKDRQVGRIKRGKGDATIATDTFSWAIAAIGPERLANVDFDPEGIMEFAEEHCRVTVNYNRPDGEKVKITGFDFAKPQHIARGGIVSSEWTAQAIVTFQMLSDYFKKEGNLEKANYYYNKVRFYLNELQKMIISSLSKTGQGKGCLPYATMPNARTGHGWKTPNGDKTGSVAGTAYGIFAWMRFNPFEID